MLLLRLVAVGSWCRTLGMGSERRERMRVLGARLRALRAEAGLTGAALAQRAGVGQPTVSKVETGRMVPSMDVLDRLCRALNLDELAARKSMTCSSPLSLRSPPTPNRRGCPLGSSLMTRSAVLGPCGPSSASFCLPCSRARSTPVTFSRAHRTRPLRLSGGLSLRVWSGRACCTSLGASRCSC